MTKSGQVLRRKVFHTTLGCSHLTQWKNVLPQPAIHQNSMTHITFSKGSSNSSRFNTTKINRSVKQGENWKIICKNLKQRLYWRNEKKSNLRTLKNENENKNWPALRICHVIWIEKLPHIIDQLQQVISLACPDGAETMEVMDFRTKLSHLYMPCNCKSLNLQDNIHQSKCRSFRPNYHIYHANLVMLWSNI